MAFTDYGPEFTVITLPEARRQPTRQYIGSRMTPRSVTKPHQHHVVTITQSTQLDTTERIHDEVHDD